MRAALCATVLLSGALAALFAAGRPPQVLDPDVQRLLRAMAVLKSSFVVAAVAGIWWRCGGTPLRASQTIGVLVSVAAMSSASVLVWYLQALGPASVAFHGGLLALLLLALWDDRTRRPARPTTRRE
jgi:hypothetical protein